VASYTPRRIRRRQWQLIRLYMCHSKPHQGMIHFINTFSLLRSAKFFANFFCKYLPSHHFRAFWRCTSLSVFSFWPTIQSESNSNFTKLTCKIRTIHTFKHIFNLFNWKKKKTDSLSVTMFGCGKLEEKKDKIYQHRQQNYTDSSYFTNSIWIIHL
jgi:hypothetical protein